MLGLIIFWFVPRLTKSMTFGLFRFGDLARISQVKDELVRNLKLLVDEEKRQLENDLGRKLEELDKMKKRHREEENRVEKEIGVLTEKMDNLTVPPVLLAQ
jgi:hypothetical protein